MKVKLSTANKIIWTTVLLSFTTWLIEEKSRLEKKIIVHNTHEMQTLAMAYQMVRHYNNSGHIPEKLIEEMKFRAMMTMNEAEEIQEKHS